MEMRGSLPNPMMRGEYILGAIGEFALCLIDYNYTGATALWIRQNKVEIAWPL